MYHVGGMQCNMPSSAAFNAYSKEPQGAASRWGAAAQYPVGAIPTFSVYQRRWQV
jgi:hypothetical protein